MKVLIQPKLKATSAAYNPFVVYKRPGEKISAKERARGDAQIEKIQKILKKLGFSSERIELLMRGVTVDEQPWLTSPDNRDVIVDLNMKGLDIALVKKTIKKAIGEAQLDYYKPSLRSGTISAKPQDGWINIVSWQKPNISLEGNSKRALFKVIL